MKPFKIGDIIEVKVTGVEQYGIFVKVNDEYSGLIHISEIDNNFIKNVNDYAYIGETIYANIIGINEENKHINLSIKNMNYTNNADENRKVKESISGFLPLHNQLEIWIEEKINEMKKEND